MRLRHLLALGIAPVTVTLACRTDAPSAPPGVALVNVSIGQPTLLPGQITAVSATAFDSKGRMLVDEPIAWSSSSAAIATVDEGGNVLAVSPGSATITATARGVEGGRALVVMVPVDSVVVTALATTMPRGASVQLTAATLDSAGATLTGRSVQWSSSQPTVATVSLTGAVTGINPGTAIVTATSEGRSSGLEIIVTTDVASVSIGNVATPIPRGTSRVLSATVRNAAGSALAGRAVAWSSSDTTVVSMSANGTATWRGVGAATVTATSEGVSGDAIVTAVTDVVSVTVTSPRDTLRRSTSLQMFAQPRNASGSLLGGRPLTWSSSDSAVANVSATGLVTGVSTGSVTITATTDGVSGSRTLSVITDVKSVTVSPASFTGAVADTRQFSAIARDSLGATISGRTVTWNSVAPSVATVQPSGLATAVSEGTAEIQAVVDGVSGSAVFVVANSCAATVYTVATAISGELTAGDCPRFGGVSVVEDRFTVTFEQAVLASWNAGGSSAVSVIRPLWTSTATGPAVFNNFGPASTDAYTMFAAGTYTFALANLVTPALPISYTFTMSASALPAATMPATCALIVVAVGAGVSVAPSLPAGGCTSGAPADAPHHRWALYLSAGQTLTATMNSPELDPFLTLLSVLPPTEWTPGSVVAVDDNSGGGTTAQLIFIAPAGGFYELRSAATSAGQSGTYTLSLNITAAGESLRAAPRGDAAFPLTRAP